MDTRRDEKTGTTAGPIPTAVPGFSGFACHDGWYDLLDELSATLEAHLKAHHPEMVDFELICGDVKSLLTPWDLYDRHRETVVWLDKTLGQAHDGPTVVRSQHAPSLRSTWNVDSLTPAYCSDLEWLVKEHQPALWLHGHTHEAVDYQIGQTRVTSNPRGYAPIQTVPGFDPYLVLMVSS